VLCVDEKSQIQPARQRPAPSPKGPMSGGIGGQGEASRCIDDSDTEPPTLAGLAKERYFIL